MPSVLATLLSATLHGLDGRVIRVEVDVAPGLPGFTIVGLPDAALSEARERVRGALRNAGFVHPPRRITVNLAPAELRKAGASLDLAIALGILLGSEQILAADGPAALIGELGLGGEVRRVPGLLPMCLALRDRGIRRVLVPADAAGEAGLAPGIDVVAVVDRGGGRDLAARRAAGAGCAVPLPRAASAPEAAGLDPGRQGGERPAPCRRRPATDLADVRGS